eukprot:12341072-Alexandrium_andersonii.AAC.1
MDEVGREPGGDVGEGGGPGDGRPRAEVLPGGVGEAGDEAPPGRCRSRGGARRTRGSAPGSRRGRPWRRTALEATKSAGARTGSWRRRRC